MSHPNYQTLAEIADRIGDRIGTDSARERHHVGHARALTRMVARDALEAAGARHGAASDFAERAVKGAMAAHTIERSYIYDHTA